MASSGGTTGTPISSGSPGAGSAALPIPWTFLSLPRYAKIMGINPAHFCRAYASSVDPVIFPISSCSNVWPRFSWQNNDQVSHEELAYAIKSAEDDIVAAVGYFPAPDWIEQEVHDMTREFGREYHSDGIDVRGQVKRISAGKGKVIIGGRRALTLVGTATVAGGSLTYTDVDGDGLEEVATITMATSLTNANEIKIYFTGMSGDRDWEIRPLRSKSISGGTLTITVDSWLLIDPELLSDYPDGDFRAIDISTTVNYVTSVDVYREYNDNTAVSAEFVWQGVEMPTSYTAFSASSTMTNEQNGVMLVTDGPDGIVMPVPGSYDSTNEKWVSAAWTEKVMPDYVRLYYYSGEYSSEYLRGYSLDPLSNFWAQTIAWVATARITRPLCGCQSTVDLAERLSEDIALSQQGRAHFTPINILSNPLGTRRGEVMAWRRISKLVKDRRASFAVI